MLMNSQKLCEMSDAQFEELITLIRYSALNASDLSSNVAMSFLSNMPSESKVEGASNYDFITEEDRRYMDYYEDDRPIEPVVADSSSESVESRKEQLTSIKYRLARILAFMRDRKRSKAVNTSDPITDNQRRYKKEKFNISYADLMVPSRFNYDPKLLDVPLHDFRKRSMSVSDSIEIKVIPNDDSHESYEYKLHPFPIESNALFRQKHPWLHPTLSFTKLCRIKYVFMSLPNTVNHLDPSTSAIAWSLFERLVFMGIVTKFNRKLYSSICFILAYKFNQDYEFEVINEILAVFTRDKNMDAKSIFYNEMTIFTRLDFSLKLKYSYIQTHIRQYLDFNKQSFFNLYDTNESTYIMLEME